ncbi:Fic family protein [Leyella stercorea]|uniref:Fic family protein n=1 Tax=Leyella stercorea TaxID=363265 RepID=UPI00258A6965|nr:Fic family protein [Leyella stercorea]
MVRHITRFVSGLWQIHPFGEGNTRTTAVFTILYLHSIGFKVNNDLLPNTLGISETHWFVQTIKTLVWV